MSKTPDLDRPVPYRVADRREWIISDEPDTAGLAISVRTSITNREQATLLAQHDALTGAYAEQWAALPAADRDMADSPRAREKTLIAPLVLDWNAEGEQEDGTIAPLPPPAEAGPAVFEAISIAEMDWITRIVLLGYLATGKAGGWRMPSGTAGATFGPRIVPDAA